MPTPNKTNWPQPCYFFIALFLFWCLCKSMCVFTTRVANCCCCYFVLVFLFFLCCRLCWFLCKFLLLLLTKYFLLLMLLLYISNYYMRWLMLLLLQLLFLCNCIVLPIVAENKHREKKKIARFLFCTIFEVRKPFNIFL